MCWWGNGEICSISLVVVPVGAELVHDALGVDGVPDDDRVDHNREAQRLARLLFGSASRSSPFKDRSTVAMNSSRMSRHRSPGKQEAGRVLVAAAAWHPDPSCAERRAQLVGGTQLVGG